MELLTSDCFCVVCILMCHLNLFGWEGRNTWSMFAFLVSMTLNGRDVDTYGGSHFMSYGFLGVVSAFIHMGLPFFQLDFDVHVIYCMWYRIRVLIWPPRDAITVVRVFKGARAGQRLWLWLGRIVWMCSVLYFLVPLCFLFLCIFFGVSLPFFPLPLGLAVCKSGVGIGYVLPGIDVLN